MIEDVRNRHRSKTKVEYVVKGDDVLLAVDKREKQSEGGIILALSASREAHANEEATILQIGKTAFSHLPDEEKYTVGDRVAITRYSGKLLGVGDDGLDRVCIVDTGIHALIIEKNE